MAVFSGTPRFVPRRCLGFGSFGTVFEVFDLERQSVVALKCPHETTSKGLYLFKKEFRALAEVSHPNLVALHELVSEGTQWFFTMEMVEGTDLLHYLRDPGAGSGSHGDADSSPASSPHLLSDDAEFTQSWGSDDPDTEVRYPEGEDGPPACPPPDLARVKDAFRQLAEGLMAIHQAGQLHRDLKPSNVRVTEQGRVVILDFGLATESSPLSEPTEMRAAEIVGAPAYIAPEQFTDDVCSEAADWYSVGVLLYQVLTGRLPFQGKDLRSLINKLSFNPPAPSQLIPGLPSDLSLLSMDLLRPNPRERPSGYEVLARLARSEAGLDHPLPLEHALFGRDREMDALLRAFDTLQEGHPLTIRLHARSGLGKSFLLRKFRQELLKRSPRPVVLSGRCYQQEHVPFKALDGVVDALSYYLRRLPPSRVEALLPRHVDALAQLFPVLLQVPAISEVHQRHKEASDPQEQRRRAFGALRELLGRIGDHVSLVLLIDDLQWGDLDSGALLADLLRPPDAPVLLLVECYQTEESTTSPLLQTLLSTDSNGQGPSQEIELNPLPPDQARQMAVDLMGPQDERMEDLAVRIARESQGNPFFIQELTRYVRLDAPVTWTAQTDSLQAYIRLRIAALPQEACRILELAALASYPLEWWVLKQAALADTGGLASLDALRLGRLVRVRVIQQRRMVETYHDFIRRTVLDTLSEAQAREGHLRIAHALEATPKRDAQALAMHFRAAGDTRKAIEYATLAGLQAAVYLAFERAATMFKLSLQLRPPDDQARPLQWIHLGEVLVNAGRSREAAEAFLQALPGVSPRQALRLQRVAAEEFLRSGQYDRGITVLEQVLASVGAHLAATPAEALFSALWHKLLLRLRGLKMVERNLEEIPQASLDRLDIYWAATMGLSCGDLMRVADFQARQLLLGLKVGEPFRLTRVLTYEAIFLASGGTANAALAQNRLDLALVLAERTGMPEALGYALVASGVVDTLLGRWRPAAEKLIRAKAFLRERCPGLTYERRTARQHILLNHYVLGNLLEIAQILPVAIKEAKETGDFLALANLTTGVSFIHHLARNQPQEALLELSQIMEQLPPDAYVIQRYQELVAVVNIELYAGNPERAREALLQRWDAIQRSRLLDVQAVRITCTELQARTLLAMAADQPKGSPERARLQARARRHLLAIRREGTDYGLALARKLEAMVAWIEGEQQEARGRMLVTETAFEACGMALHAAVMKRCRGISKGAAGQSLVQAAEGWMQGQGIVDPARMMAMHLPGVKV